VDISEATETTVDEVTQSTTSLSKSKDTDSVDQDDSCHGNTDSQVEDEHEEEELKPLLDRKPMYQVNFYVCK